MLDDRRFEDECGKLCSFCGRNFYTMLTACAGPNENVVFICKACVREAVEFYDYDDTHCFHCNRVSAHLTRDGQCPKCAAKPLRKLQIGTALAVGIERMRLGTKQGWTCIYCNGKGQVECGPDGRTWHIDHVYPRSRGGDNGPDNLALACATCNLAKRANLGFGIPEAIPLA